MHRIALLLVPALLAACSEQQASCSQQELQTRMEAFRVGTQDLAARNPGASVAFAKRVQVITQEHYEGMKNERNGARIFGALCREYDVLLADLRKQAGG
jgi:hypothetical protein